MELPRNHLVSKPEARDKSRFILALQCVMCFFQLLRQHVTFPDYFHPNISKYWGELIKDFHNIIEFDGLWIVSMYELVKT